MNPMHKHPPEPDDCGITCDRLGNVIVYFKPHMMDDIINELKHGEIKTALAMLNEPMKDFFPVPMSLHDQLTCEAYCLTPQDLADMREKFTQTTKENI